MKSMEQAHAEDYADKRRMDDIRLSLEAFLADPPSRCHKDTLYMLRDGLRLLKKDADHIVAVWD